MKPAINIISFVALIALGRWWISVDQYVLPQLLLMPAFILLFAALLTGYFFIVNPRSVKRMAVIISLLLFPVIVGLSLVQHLALNHDFAAVWRHSLIIWALALIMPFVGGGLYAAARKMMPTNRNAGSPGR